MLYYMYQRKLFTYKNKNIYTVNKIITLGNPEKTVSWSVSYEFTK